MNRRQIHVLCFAIMLFCSAAADAIAQTSAGASTDKQRGDVAFGYSFMHETGLALPIGITLSDAWRPNVEPVDFVSEVQFNHGSLEDFSFNISGILAGVRFSSGSRYGSKTSAFGQLLVGYVHVGVSEPFSEDAAVDSFGWQPGFGFETALTKTVAIRPQFDVLFTNESGLITKDVRFNVNVVFRLFKQ